MDDPVWWAYGVVSSRPSGQAALRGLEGHPVQPVEQDGLVALVSPVPGAEFSGKELERRLNDLDKLGRMARDHDAVLEGAMSDGDVVPFRMCTLYATRDAVRAMLVSERPRLLEALARVQDAVELGVKAFVSPRDRADTRRPSTGTEYLARRMAQRNREAASEESLERSVAELHARLTDRASAAVLLRPQHRQLSGRKEEMILNGAYLVRRGEAPGFAQMVETLGRDDLALEVTGPWPPYHFAQVNT